MQTFASDFDALELVNTFREYDGENNPEAVVDLFETYIKGVRIHLLNGQQFGTLRRSSQRCGSKSRGKGGATDTDSCSVPEPAMRSVSDTATGKHAFCRSDNIPALRSESRPADSTGDCAVPTSGGTTQSSAESTLSGYADIDHL